MSIPRYLLVLALLAFAAVSAQADAVDSATPDDQLADDILRLLTDPGAYPEFSGHRLERQGEAEYRLWILGDDASAVLVQALGADTVAARINAARLLRKHGDESALDALRMAFLAEGNGFARRTVASTIESISPTAAADMLADSLVTTPAKDVYDDRLRGLLRLGDARALAHVRRFVPAEVTPDTHAASAVLCLVEAGDRDAIPLLLKYYEVLLPKDMYSRWGHAPVIVALAALDDERLAKVVATALRVSGHAVQKTPLPSILGSQLVPYLFSGDLHEDRTSPEARYRALRAVHMGEGVAGWDGAPPSMDHVDLYGRAFLDGSAYAEPRARASSDRRLRQMLAEILASLGAEGREYLRQGVREQHCHREALGALASYNDITALHYIAALAADPEYTHRSSAVRPLARSTELWPEEAEPYWLALAGDDSIDAVVGYATAMYRNPYPGAEDLLAKLLQASDPGATERVKQSRLRMYGPAPLGIPTGLEIGIATDRPSYSYDAHIMLTMELVNGSDQPITLHKHLLDGPENMAAFLDVDLVMPNGDRRTYLDLDRGLDGVMGSGQFLVSAPSGRRRGALTQTLAPGDHIGAELDLRKYCRPAQPGVYHAQLVYGRPARDRHLRGTTAGDPWTVIRSNTVEFVVKPPPDEQVDRLVSQLDIDHLTSEDTASVVRISYMLGELGDPRAIHALRDLALLLRRRSRVPNAEAIVPHAIAALAKFDTPAMVPVWIDMLPMADREWNLPAEQLAKLGDRRAVGPLREHALNSRHVASAKALAALGDDSVIRFLRWRALQEVDIDDPSTWTGAKARALTLLLPGEDLAGRLLHEHPAMRWTAVWTASKEGRADVLSKALNDADARVRLLATERLAGWDETLDTASEEYATHTDALQRALSHADPEVRRTAAIVLARLGDSSGKEVLRADLHAVDYSTRVAARSGLVSLRRWR
jgi:HEAT repeat protein